MTALVSHVMSTARRPPVVKTMTWSEQLHDRLLPRPLQANTTTELVRRRVSRRCSDAWGDQLTFSIVHVYP